MKKKNLPSKEPFAGLRSGDLKIDVTLLQVVPLEVVKEMPCERRESKQTDLKCLQTCSLPATSTVGLSQPSLPALSSLKTFPTQDESQIGIHQVWP